MRNRNLMCLACKKKLAKRRGLCDRDYNLARQQIARGETTWSELAGNGQALLTPLERGVEEGPSFCRRRPKITESP